MKPHLDGARRRSNHTTLIDLAAKVVDLVEDIDSVSGISPGHIQNGKGVTGGMRKVKIGDLTGGILLTVRQSRSVQELRVYARDIQAAKLAIAQALRTNDIAISFRHD